MTREKPNRTKRQFSLYLPEALLAELDAMAEANFRNRQQEVERLLTDAVARERKSRKKPADTS